MKNLQSNFFTREYYLNHNTGWQLYGVVDDFKKHSVMYRTFMLNPSIVESAVDLGGGRGELTKYLSKLGVKTTYIDYSKDAVQLAKSYVDDDNVTFLNINCMDILDYFEESSIDLIVINQVFQYLNPVELSDLLSYISVILKPGARLVFNLPIPSLSLDNASVCQYHLSQLKSLAAKFFNYYEVFCWNGTIRSDLEERYHIYGFCVKEFEHSIAECNINLPLIIDRDCSGWVDLSMNLNANIDSRTLISIFINIKLLYDIKNIQLLVVGDANISSKPIWISLDVNDLRIGCNHVFLSLGMFNNSQLIQSLTHHRLIVRALADNSQMDMLVEKVVVYK